MELKNILLNNQIIKDLITNNNTLAIYLGGSRLLNLELSGSDYDIIVVSKEKAIMELNGAHLGIYSNNKVHIQSICFYDIIKNLNMPNENPRAVQMLCLLQFLLDDIDYLYQSEEYKSIQNILKKYYDKLCYFCLEKLLENLGKPQINSIYLKSDYHYICFDFMLSNYKKYKKLTLTSEQKDQIKLIKETRKVPAKIIDTLEKRTFKQYQFYYKDYKEIYQEVVACQKQFI